MVNLFYFSHFWTIKKILIEASNLEKITWNNSYIIFVIINW